MTPGPVNGVLAVGLITSTDQIGPLTGMDLSDLMYYILNHEAYVNAHTSQFPGGEIRGTAQKMLPNSADSILQ